MIFLTLIFIIVGTLTVTRAWLSILTLKSSESGPLPESSIIQNDATIIAWSRRARMYAESSKKNQNADRNTTVTTSQSTANTSARFLFQSSVILNEPRFFFNQGSII